MAVSDLSWLDIIPADHPKYQSWLVLRGFLQRQESEAQAEILEAFRKNGVVEIADVLTYVERWFDWNARTILTTATEGTIAAERAARRLDDLLEEAPNELRSFFLAVESFTGIAADRLEAETKPRLIPRLLVCKAEAFRIGSQGEISKVRKPTESQSPFVAPSRGEARSRFIVTTWQDVEISFFNETSVRIAACGSRSNHECRELGMADIRNDKPKLAWHTLHLLAKMNGKISVAPDWKVLEKRMQELRKWLRELFGLSTDPLPFKKGTDSGYVAEFKIHRAPSYRE
jgi:hypothetical protein